MELRDRIKTARKALGISQEQLARDADVSLSLINQIERGVVTDPHYSTLVSIAAALSMPIGELLEDPVPLADAPQGSGQRSEEQERQIIEGIIGPWVGWLERDTKRLEQLVHDQEVTASDHENTSANRRNIAESLDEAGDRLKALGIDWRDRQNRPMRRAHDALERAFGEWADASLEVSEAYLDSRALAEEEGLLGRTRPDGFVRHLRAVA